jgi:hypothetical protein
MWIRRHSMVVSYVQELHLSATDHSNQFCNPSKTIDTELVSAGTTCITASYSQDFVFGKNRSILASLLCFY